jgi:very-short-patch-repair endonuclease
MRQMSVVRRLVELGGTAGYRQLVAVAGRTELAKAVECGEVVRLSRGRYALPELEKSALLAHAIGGVLSHTSAALAWGWGVKHVPGRPHVTIPVKRKVRSTSPVQLHRRDLSAEETRDGRTSQGLTIEQCLRSLPLDEGLAVADSALRDGFSPTELRSIARDARGPGSSRFRQIAERADGRSANPFESVLRAICWGVPGLAVQPQVQIGQARVDLADVEQRIVLEADSFEWHGGRRALRRDAQRYNRLVVDGWMVLRFAWEDVMFAQEAVRGVLIDAQRRSNRERDAAAHA